MIVQQSQCVPVVQFLLQDAVRARLSKEAFDFEESQTAGSNAPYAMAAAQRLTADFGRLGSPPYGLPYLDHLRHLITGERSWLQPSSMPGTQAEYIRPLVIPLADLPAV